MSPPSPEFKRAIDDVLRRINEVIEEVATAHNIDPQPLYVAIFNPYPHKKHPANSWALTADEDARLRAVCLDRIAQGFLPRFSEVEEIARKYVASRPRFASAAAITNKINDKWAQKFVSRVFGLSCNTEFGIIYPTGTIAYADMQQFWSDLNNARTNPFVPDENIFYLSFAAFEPREWWARPFDDDGRATDHDRVFMLNCISATGTVQNDPMIAVYGEVNWPTLQGAKVIIPFAYSRSQILEYWLRTYLLNAMPRQIPRTLIVNEAAARPRAKFKAVCEQRDIRLVSMSPKIAPYLVALDMAYCQSFRAWFRKYIPGKSDADYVKSCIQVWGQTKNKSANLKRWEKVSLPSSDFLNNAMGLVPFDERERSQFSSDTTEVHSVDLGREPVRPHGPQDSQKLLMNEPYWIEDHPTSPVTPAPPNTKPNPCEKARQKCQISYLVSDIISVSDYSSGPASEYAEESSSEFSGIESTAKSSTATPPQNPAKRKATTEVVATSKKRRNSL